ncbi:MAG: hypothetical protein JOY80_07875 [Candidatus Dormibacteraeota bacterium]|nr:hypothetical protein [Candidatus Dormibacteraeota bacterium]
MLVAYVAALGLTLAVEAPLYATGLRFGFGLRWSSGFAAGVAVNLVTHPLGLVLVGPALAPFIGPTATLAVIEIGAWWLEAAMLYAWLRRDVAVLAGVAFVANGASLAAGLLLLR